MIGAVPVVASMWAFMTSWFTPTVLFCVVNLVIGTIFITSNFKTQNKYHHQQQQQFGDSPQLVRVPSLLDRVRSFDFSLYRSQLPDPSQPDTQYTNPPHHQTLDQNPTQDPDHHVTRSKSDTSCETPAISPAKVKKSASEKYVVAKLEKEVEVVDHQRPVKVLERKGNGKGSTDTAWSKEDEAVDAKADDFINRFRQQLKMQRLDSLQRYKEMLSRGSWN